MEETTEQTKNILPDYEAEVTLWDVIIILLHNWKLITIITVFVTIIGLLFGLSEQNKPEYVFSQQIIYDDYNYYPINFVSTYELSLHNYIQEEYDNVKAKFDAAKDDYCLTINYTNLTYDEAAAITQDIISRHNLFMYDECNRLLTIKQEEADAAYDAYIDKQNTYHDFMYGIDGFYDTESNLFRYQRYVNSYEVQLENYQTLLLKVENGFPLLLNEIYLDEGMPMEYYQRDEIIENHYSAEKLKKEIEFLETELASNQSVYAEFSDFFNQMTISEVTLKSKRDIALESWTKREKELNNLSYDISRTSEYYVGNFLLSEETGYSFIMFGAISFIIGLMISVFFIFVKASYQNYSNKES